MKFFSLPFVKASIEAGDPDVLLMIRSLTYLYHLLVGFITIFVLLLILVAVHHCRVTSPAPIGCASNHRKGEYLEDNLDDSSLSGDSLDRENIFLKIV